MKGRAPGRTTFAPFVLLAACHAPTDVPRKEPIAQPSGPSSVSSAGLPPESDEAPPASSSTVVAASASAAPSTSPSTAPSTASSTLLVPALGEPCTSACAAGLVCCAPPRGANSAYPTPGLCSRPCVPTKKGAKASLEGCDSRGCRTALMP